MLGTWLGWLFSRMSFWMLSVTPTQKFPPPLSPKEESALFLAMREEDTKGDAPAVARSSLIEHNLRLVAHIVRKYYTAQASQDDLLSIGTIGLIKAVDSYNIHSGARFATYAAKCIQNAILS